MCRVVAELDDGPLGERLGVLLSPDELAAIAIRATDLLRDGHFPDPDAGLPLGALADGLRTGAPEASPAHAAVRRRRRHGDRAGVATRLLVRALVDVDVVDRAHEAVVVRSSASRRGKRSIGVHSAPRMPAGAVSTM